MSTKSNTSKDLKYVLLPIVENRRREPKFQPWYRERFKMKYPCHINTKNWKFVKDGLDDFRDGLPPPHDDIMLEPDRGPGPVIFSQKRRVKAAVSDARDRLDERQLYFSRELPTAEKRRQLIDYYISTLLDHPMAFFPHFNQILSPDMYERITKLLEDELTRVMNDEQHFLTDEHRDFLSLSPSVPLTGLERSTTGKTASEHSSRSNNNNNRTASAEEEEEMKKKPPRPGITTIVYDESGNPWDSEEYEKKQKNPYRWYIDKQREIQKLKGPTREEIAASAMEAHLRKVAEHFCTWLYGLGGETNFDIDPAVVRNLFSTAYDTKPSLDVPIKIVPMTRIPSELRDGTQDTAVTKTDQRKPTLAKSRSNPQTRKANNLTSLSIDSSQSRKYRYGAWYLPTNLWQRSLTTEQLQDPKELKAEREDVTKIREEETNAYLAPLHGVDAFKDYLVEKNVRRLPKLIIDVEQYRRNHPHDVTSSTTDFQRKETL